MTPRLDHVAIAARSLDEGAAWLAARGLILQPGGRHPGMGTHNMLMALGPGEYLELIAPDPEADVPPAWFGLADHQGPPRLAGWVVAEPDLQAPPGTRAMTARRGDLSWRITVPLAGQMPHDGAEPMRIDWGGGPHPSDSLPETGIRLEGLELPFDPLPAHLAVLGDGRLRSGTRFAVTLRLPSGLVTL